MRNEQKSEEIVKNTFLLLKDSEIQHQKEITQFMKENQENYAKMLEMRDNEEVQRYKKMCEENEIIKNRMKQEIET